MTVTGKIADLYNYYIYEKSDPRTSDLFLMGSPVYIIVILVSYCLFCAKYGPRIMSGRRPLQLDRIMMVYNLSQVGMNFWFFYKSLELIWIPGYYTLICQWPKNGPLDNDIAFYTYIFFICRLCDLFDTVFMVLRKKAKQMSFLHLYHHLAVASVGWFMIKYLPGGHLVVFGTLNTFVHTVMYLYFFIRSIYPTQFWWKRHITELQLVQFVLLFIQQIAAILSPTCDYPKLLLYFYLSQVLIITYLFSEFYYKEYIKPQRKKKN